MTTVEQQIENVVALGSARWEAELAVALGYDISESMKCILPMNPFEFEGDTVVVREVCVDAQFQSLTATDGEVLTRQVTHPIPAGFTRP